MRNWVFPAPLDGFSKCGWANAGAGIPFAHKLGDGAQGDAPAEEGVDGLIAGREAGLAGDSPGGWERLGVGMQEGCELCDVMPDFRDGRRGAVF